MLHSGGQYQQWPTGGRIGYITPAIRGVPNASKRATMLEVAHNGRINHITLAILEVRNPSRSETIPRSGQQVGGLAT